MSVKDSEETYLRPLYRQVGLALRLQDVQNNRHSVFIVLSDNALVSVGSIRLNKSTLFLGCLGRLMILQ
jgi:hypothetical protein